MGIDDFTMIFLLVMHLFLFFKILMEIQQQTNTKSKIAHIQMMLAMQYDL
jgi:hypothetical protein